MIHARSLASEFSRSKQRRAACLAAEATREEVACTFVEAMRRLHADARITDSVLHSAQEWHPEIQHHRDEELGFMGIDTLRSKYLLRSNAGELLETPQYLFMRVSIAKHPHNRDLAMRSYDYMSRGCFTHATPTLMNAGTPGGSLASCYLMHVEDSLESIFEGVTECAHLSKGGGGIGLDVTSVRARGSHIQSSNGTSNGIQPMLAVFGATLNYVDQGGGKRRGVAAVYMEPWHKDIMDFIRLRDPRTIDSPSLFNALWVNDVFMQRVRDGSDWSLFDPKDVPGLCDLYGPAFTRAYESYEKTVEHDTMPARSLYQEIATMQLRCGTPYMHAKHACNRTSNHAHLGTIKNSNLCGEIMQYSDAEETAVCNLASINVSAFVKDGEMNWHELSECTQFVVGEIDIVMDTMNYRSQRSERGNNRNRPMGIGIQGLADAFVLCGIPYDDPRAIEMSRDIAEHMYHAALTASCALARENGAHPSYEGSPISKGILHFDNYENVQTKLEWHGLRGDIAEYGVRHSVFIAYMPTASTSRIFGNNECFIPYTRLLYVRRTLMGEYVVCSKHFLDALHKHIGDDEQQWAAIADALTEADGCARKVPSLPEDVRALFPTVWDVKRRFAMDMCIARAPFVDQAESMSVYVDLNNTHSARDNLYKQHMYAWNKGLKTLSYYTHQNTKVKTTIGPSASGCLMCSS